MSKKVLAVVLSLILMFSAVAIPVSAAEISLPETSVENVFEMLIEKLLSFVLTYLNKYWPGYEDKWSDVENYEPEYFYAGEEEFDREVAEDAHVGASAQSLAQCFGHGNAAAHHYDVDILGGALQVEVAHIAAHDIAFESQLVGRVANEVE